VKLCTLPQGTHCFTAISEGDEQGGQVVPYAPGAYFPAVDDGVSVMLQPLPVGKHLLPITGSFPQCNCHLDLTSHLTVTP
jgi:hypothetical protein